MGFLRKEFLDLNKEVEVLDGNRVIHDTLKVARKKFPGKRNSLDALCDRFDVDKTERDTHGALLDARLLANVYLRMTKGQTNIQGLSINDSKLDSKNIEIIDNRSERVIFADEEEIEAHKNYFNSCLINSPNLPFLNISSNPFSCKIFEKSFLNIKIRVISLPHFFKKASVYSLFLASI